MRAGRCAQLAVVRPAAPSTTWRAMRALPRRWPHTSLLVSTAAAAPLPGLSTPKGAAEAPAKLLRSACSACKRRPGRQPPPSCHDLLSVASPAGTPATASGTGEAVCLCCVLASSPAGEAARAAATPRSGPRGQLVWLFEPGCEPGSLYSPWLGGPRVPERGACWSTLPWLSPAFCSVSCRFTDALRALGPCFRARWRRPITSAMPCLPALVGKPCTALRSCSELGELAGVGRRAERGRPSVSLGEAGRAPKSRWAIDCILSLPPGPQITSWLAGRTPEPLTRCAPGTVGGTGLSVANGAGL